MRNIIIFLLIILLTSCGSASISDINESNIMERKKVDIMVTDKIVKTSSDIDRNTTSKYLIFTDKWTYEITDSILSWQFNSSDIYWYIQKDKCYSVWIQALSFRLWILSSYENIASATNIECKLIK